MKTAAELLGEAIDAMEALRVAAAPCEVQTHAIIPAAAFRAFVDAQAALMHAAAHLPAFPPVAPSELMLQAYRCALRELIERTPTPQRARWKKDGRGYVIPEREKAIARYQAMLAAARAELQT